jgi:hypothetical protein
MSFEDNAAGWAEFRRRADSLQPLGVAIETSTGAVVDRLVAAGFNVYPLQPKAAKTYRERKAPSGVKDNELDAWSMADALRTDGHGWRVLKPDSARTQQLRWLCRDEHALTEERAAKINQVQAALREYYPAALEAFNDWSAPSAWAFLERFPTPQKLQKAGKRQWEEFLHTHKLTKPELYEKRMEIFSRATQFCGSEPMIAAQSMLALAYVAIIRSMDKELKKFNKRIQDEYEKHPDYHWFSSLPLPDKSKSGPRVLAELGDHRDRVEDASGFQCQAGSAPIHLDTGKQPTAAQKRKRRPKGKVRMRRACNHHFKHSMYWFSKVIQYKCAWSPVYYQKKRDDGMSDANALRCLANRWFKIIFRMWLDRKPYDANRHIQNQRKHGSWVHELMG